MISALKRIEDNAHIEHVPSLVQEAFIENPSTGFSGLFDTHPPIAARIEALVKYAGGRADAVVEGRLPRPAQAGTASVAPSPGPWGQPPQPTEGSGGQPRSAEHNPLQGTFIPPQGGDPPWGPGRGS
jgi:heat shock protein HtpX